MGITREEAIAFFKDMNECTYGNLEPVEMAIKALEKESTTKSDLEVEKAIEIIKADSLAPYSVNEILLARDLAVKALKQMATIKDDLALIHTEGLDEEIRCTMCTNSMKSDRGCDGSCAVNKDMYKAVMDAIEKRIQPITRNCFGCKYSKDNHNVGTEECHLCMWENQYTPTTKNDLDVDCISRADLYDRIKGIDHDEDYECDEFGGSRITYHTCDWDEVLREIEDAPSVTPQPRWIPVSERLPEANRAVLTYIDIVVSKTFCLAYWSDVSEAWEDWMGFDLIEKDRGYKVIAWMPLPQPYKAESEEE